MYSVLHHRWRLVEISGQHDLAGSDAPIKAGVDDKVHAAVLKARDTFEATIMEAVRHNAEALVCTMRSLPDAPSMAEVTFGVNATAEAAYSAIAKASAEASYRIRIAQGTNPGKDIPGRYGCRLGACSRALTEADSVAPSKTGHSRDPKT